MLLPNMLLPLHCSYLLYSHCSSPSILSPPLLYCTLTYSLQLTLQQGSNVLLLMVQPYLHLNDSGVSVFDLTQPADEEGPRAWADTLGNLITGDQVQESFCVCVCVSVYVCMCVCA